jgi:hypothetical protein
LRWSHDLLESRLVDCPEEAFYRVLPGSRISSVAAIYVHVVMTEDAYIQKGLRGQTPLSASSPWSERLALPARVAIDFPSAAELRLDIPTFREYAQAVFAASETCIKGLSEADIRREVDIPHVFQAEGRWTWENRPTTLDRTVSDMVILHTVEHVGEISALKGVQGLRGGPLA